MKILIIDVCGAALDWALRCQEYGHEIKWYIDKTKTEKKYNWIGTGLVPRVREWEPHMDWADLIFLTDNVKHLDKLAYYFNRGYPIFGPTWEAANLELDRQAGVEAFESVGIKTIPGQEFKSYAAAISYVKQNPEKRFVSKPNGDADKALSYVSKNSADMIFMLEKWSKSNSLKGSFIIQEFIPGMEMAVGGWFGPHGFNKYVLENWEFKKLMNDDKGVATGEQGTVMRYVTESLLAEEVLYPLEPILHKMGYVGYVDINCMIAKDGTPYPLEFTNRPGWPLFNIQQALHKGDPAQWMLDLINGKDTLKVHEKIATGVVMSQPDYPYYHLPIEEVTGIPVYGVDDSTKPWLHPCEIMAGTAPCLEDGKIVNKKMWVTAGSYIIVCSGIGKTVEESKEAAYKIVDKISFPNSPMYRTDIGCRLEKQLPKLQAMGYCEGMVFCDEGDD